MTMQEELDERSKRIAVLCDLIAALGENNGNVGEYLSALHICAGLIIRRMPTELKERTLQKFFLEVRHVARERAPSQ
jgi:hypothetical protein